MADFYVLKCRIKVKIWKLLFGLSKKDVFWLYVLAELFVYILWPCLHAEQFMYALCLCVLMEQFISV